MNDQWEAKHPWVRDPNKLPKNKIVLNNYWAKGPDLLNLIS